MAIGVVPTAQYLQKLGRCILVFVGDSGTNLIDQGFGGVSVGGLVKNRSPFGTLLPGIDHIKHTHDIERNAFSRGLPQEGARGQEES